MIKKGLKYLLITTSAILLVIILLSLLTQTSWFKAKVADRMNKFVTSKINGKLSIGEIEGNFYNYMELQNVELSNKDSLIASIPKVRLHYNLWALGKKQIDVDSLIISNPIVHLSQINDSTWNLQKIIPKKNKITEKATAILLPAINFDHFEIINGNASISSSNRLIPASINQLNTVCSVFYKTKQIEAHLKNFSIQSKTPNLRINELSILLKQDENGIEIDDFKMHTSGSNVFMNGLYKTIETLNAEIQVIPLDKNELAIFIPSLKLACSPEIRTNFKTKNDSTTTQIELKNGNQSIKVSANLSSLSKIVKGEKEKIPFQANLVINNVIPEDWLVMEKSNSLINGKIDLNGTNLFDLKSSIQVKASLVNSIYNEQKFQTFALNGIYEDGNLETTLKVESEKVDFTAQGKISNITSELPTYDFSLNSDNLNLSSIIPTVEGTFLNAKIQAKGEGITASSIKINGDIQLSNSIIYHIPIDSANLQFHLADLKIKLDTLDAIVPGGKVNGSGFFDIPELYLSVQAKAQLDTLQIINHYVTLPIEFKSANANGKIEGPVSRLIVSGDVVANNAVGYLMKIDSLQSSVVCRIIKDSLQVNTNTKAINLTAASVLWDTLTSNVLYKKDYVEADINANWQDTLKAKIRTRVQLGDTIRIALPRFDVQTVLADFYLQDTLQTVDIQPNSINFNTIWIKDKIQPDFNLKLNGSLTVDQPDNIQINIEKLNLKHINRMLPMEDSIHGLLSTAMSISGTPKDPIFKGNINIENPGYNTIHFSSFSGEVSYAEKMGKMDFSLPDLGSTGLVNAPLELFYDSTGFVVNPPETFEAELKIDSLNISQQYSNMLSGIDIAGSLNVDISAKGTIKNPQIFGFLNIKNGQFKHRGLGINYDNVTTQIKLDGAKVIVDTLLIKQEKGFLSTSGEVTFDSTIISGEVVSTTLVADAKNFNVVRSQNYKLLVDANTFVKMGKTYPEFGGKVNVIQSEFFLPKLLGIDKQNENQNDSPLLLQALHNTSDSIAINALKESQLDKNEKISDFRKNLTGRIKIIIPRNTWLKSDEMNLELRGDLDFVKTGPFFELFGDVTVNRGHYILYGRKMVMQESRIIFQGGIDFDPTLDIIAEYTFRDSKKTKRILALTVNGLLSDPSINFTLDGSYLSESDAVSVLVFGQTPDEMDTNGQNGLVGSVGSNMVAQVLTSQLNKTLGSALNLDMVEITATENWQSAAFVVGKYITNDLFMTYQRGFGETEGDEITPETLTLEYELNRIFFLHLQSGNSKDSGIDVVLKFEQKIEN